MLISAILTLGIVVLVCVMSSKLPEQIPTHYNFLGEVDGWGHKSTIWWIVGFQVLQFIVLGCLSRYPQYYNYPIKVTDENRERLYCSAANFVSYLALALSIFLAYIVAVLLQLVPISVGLVLLYLFFSMFVVPMYYIYRTVKH